LAALDEAEDDLDITPLDVAVVRQTLPELPGSPDDFGKLITEETEKWAKVVKAGLNWAKFPSDIHKSRCTKSLRVSVSREC
jgi:hypothetical protein